MTQKTTDKPYKTKQIQAFREHRARLKSDSTLREYGAWGRLVLALKPLREGSAATGFWRQKNGQLDWLNGQLDLYDAALRVGEFGEANRISKEISVRVGALAREERSNQAQHERRSMGSKKSAEKRREDNIARDRRIHDARRKDKNLKAKDIARDKIIVGDKLLSASQVRKILKRPRP